MSKLTHVLAEQRLDRVAEEGGSLHPAARLVTGRTRHHSQPAAGVVSLAAR